MMSSSSSRVQRISECFIKPLHPIKDSNQICNLTKWDIALLSSHYIQQGFLFKKPPNNQQQDYFINNLLEKLKHSLSLTLFHFYPLAGHLVTNKTEHPPSYTIHVDCNNNNNKGAKIIYATLNSTISDILSPVYVPPVVESLFDLDRAINHDGHTLPLLSIQVTELVDGVFIGCSMNHSIADGTSFWNFFNTWSHPTLFIFAGFLKVVVHQSIFPLKITTSLLVDMKHLNYFGNYIDALYTETTAAGELLDNDLGWAAFKVHVAVANHDDKKVRELLKKWLEDPVIYQTGVHFDPFCVSMSNSPRFNIYGIEFGMGKAVAVLSGYGNKVDGNVTTYESYDGSGSIDLAVCLSPDAMSKLESDEEFMNFASVPNPSYSLRSLL